MMEKELKDLCERYHCVIHLSCVLHDKEFNHPITVNYITDEEGSPDNMEFMQKVLAYDKTLNVKVRVSFKTGSYMRFYNAIDKKTFKGDLEHDIIKYLD